MIRFAEIGDIPQLVEMGMRFLGSTPRYIGRIEGNRALIELHFLQLMNSENAAFLVLGERGHVHGMIAGVHYAHQHSGAATVAELFWWVNPESRGGGLQLYHALVAWARHVCNAEFLQMTSPSKKVARIYRKLGFAPLEEVFIKRL